MSEKNPNPNNISRPKAIAFTCIAIVLGLLIFELICSLIIQNRYIALDPINPKMAQKIPGYFMPNQDRILLFPGMKEYQTTTNSMGLRITSPEDEEPESLLEIEDRFKILCLGDSETFGLFVDDEGTYPYQLQSLLKKQGKEAIVLNAGIGGATISDSLDYYKRKGDEIKPNIVIIQFYDNDLLNLRGQSRTMYQEMLDKSNFDLATQLKMLASMRIGRPMEYYFRLKRWISKIEDDRARAIEEEGSTELEDVLYHYVAVNGDFSVKPHSKEYTDLWEEYFEMLDELNRLVKENGGEMIFVMYPSITTLFDRAEVYYQDIFKHHLNMSGIAYVDMRDVLKPERDDYLKLYTKIPRDAHLSVYGKKRLVEALWTILENKVR